MNLRTAERIAYDPPVELVSALNEIYDEIWEDEFSKPIDATMLTKKGRQLAMKGDVKKAIAVFQDVLVLDPSLDLEPENEARKSHVQGLLVEGNKLLSTKQYEKAIETFTDAIEIDPNEAKTYHLRGQVYEVLGQYAQAIQDYTTSLERDPDNALAYKDRGHVYFQLQQDKQALADYEKTIELESENSWFFDSFCRIGSLQGYASEVLDVCEQAVALASENGKFQHRNSRGLARALTGDVAGAIEDFQAYVGWAEQQEWASEERSKEYIATRQRWIQSLQAGENPFTPELLEELRKE